MAEAMIINSLLDASPKQLQQLHMQPHHILQQVQSQQSCSSSNDNNNCNSNNNSSDKSFPGYLYSCYPFVMPHTQPNLHQHSSNDNGLPTSSCSVPSLHLQFQHQQLQLLTSNSGSSTQQQQQAMLHNNVLQNSCVPGYYSIVPVQAMMTGEGYASQPSLLTNHQFQSSMHIDPALSGPLVQYPFSYVSIPPPLPPSHLLQQQQQQQQQYHQYLNQQAMQQSCSQNFLCPSVQNGATNLLNNLQPHQLLPRSPSQLLMQLPLHLPPSQQSQSAAATGCDDVNRSSQKKVVILKDASVCTDFNEKVCNKTLRDYPSSLYLGVTEHFQSCLETDTQSKATETISLSENSSISNPGICRKFPSQHFGMNCYQAKQKSIPRQMDPLTLPSGINSKKTFFPTQGQFQGPVFPFTNFALTSNVQSFYLPVIGGNSYFNLSTNYSQHPIQKNANHFANTNQRGNFKNESDHIETDKKQKFYRKTRADPNQKVASPIFEVNKEFTDLLNAAGSLIAQSVTTESLEPVDDGRSSQSSVPSKSSSMSHDEKHKYFKHDSNRAFYKIDNSRANKKSGRLDFYNKAPSGLPLAEFCNIPWQFNRQGIIPRQNNVELNWTWNGSYKNHDARSTKRKQQKRQMLANKAADEELEEISRERENLLKGILGNKQLLLNNDIPAEKTHPDDSDDKQNSNENKSDDLNNNQQVQQCRNEAEEICSCDKENVSDDIKLDSVDIEAKCCEDFMETGTDQLEFVDPVDFEPQQHTRIPNQDSKFSRAINNITNSLEENPSPLSQLSPLTFSPPLSCPNDLVVSEDASGTIASKIHSRRFREYCNQVLDKEIDNRCVQLLQDLVKFQDQMYHSDPSKAKLKKRFVLGLREVAKHLKVKKLKCVIISPNLEQTQSKGGLDETLKSIIEMCQAQEVPFIFALGRRALGRACAKLVPVSVVGIFSYDGVEENFAALKNLTEKAREAYSEMVNSFKREITNSNTVDAKEVVESQSNTHDEDCEAVTTTSANNTQTSQFPCSIPATTTTATTVTSVAAQPPGNFEKLFPHLGHSRTPSACSAISFVSSILSEPISENLPQSEPENDTKGHDVEKSESDRDNHHCSSANVLADSIESDNINAEIKSSLHPLGEMDDEGKKSGSNICCGESFSNNENYLLTSRNVDEVSERNISAPVKTVLTSINELLDESEVAFVEVGHVTDRSCDKDGLSQIKENCFHEDLLGALPYYCLDEKLPGVKLRKSSAAEDPDDDGNEADTEDDKSYKNIGQSRCRSRDRIGSSPASNVSLPCRIKSKDDRSDDDRTVILAKEIDETSASAAVDENLHNRQISRDNNLSFSSAIGEVAIPEAKSVLSKSSRSAEATKSASLLVCKKVGVQGKDQPTSFEHDFKSFEKHPCSEESSLILTGNLPCNTSTTSRIETWVAESQKALSGYGRGNEDEDEEVVKCDTDNEEVDVESDNNDNDGAKCHTQRSRTDESDDFDD